MNEETTPSLAHRLGAGVFAAIEGLKAVTIGRMSQWTWATVILLGILFWISAELVGPMVKVTAKLTLAAILGYAVDRTLFKNARPHMPLDAAARLADASVEERLAEGMLSLADVLHRRFQLEMLAAAYMLRRAFIVGLTILGSATAL